MKELESAVGSASVDESINRVLTAERVARDAVAECRRQALIILEDAREQARRIEMRAEGRISAVSALADFSIRRKRSPNRSTARRRATSGSMWKAAVFTEQPDLPDEQLTRLDTVIDHLTGELMGTRE